MFHSTSGDEALYKTSRLHDLESRKRWVRALAAWTVPEEGDYKVDVPIGFYTEVPFEQNRGLF